MHKLAAWSVNMDRFDFVPTSIAVRMTARLRATHQRAGISVFSGPPGLGKTTAIEAFKAEFDGSVAIVKIATLGVRELTVLQHMIEAIDLMSRAERRFHQPTGGTYETKNRLADRIAEWTRSMFGVHWSEIEARRAEVGPLTFVFDEAQNLSRNAIETLRYWNDRDRCYGPFPIGLIFVGNNEFALASDRKGSSAISAAVADRALFVEQYSYADLSNEDIRLFVAAKGIADRDAQNAIVKHYSTPRTPRSLRQIERLALDIIDEAGGAPASAQHAWAVLETL